MKNIALVMTPNLLYKNKFIDDLIKENNKSIKLLIKLEFRNPNTSLLKHNYTYLNLIGMKGFFYIFYLYFLRFKERLITPSKRRKYSTLSEISKKYNIAYKTIDSVNSKSFYELVNNYKIDFIINSANQIYSKNTLDSLNAKIINRHTSLLPQYGGIYPVFWQMLNNEEYGGVTLHWIDERVDKGEIAYQEKFLLDESKSLFQHYKTAFEISLKLCNELIQDLNNDKVIMIDSNLQESYYSWPTKDDVKNFKKYKNKIV